MSLTNLSHCEAAYTAATDDDSRQAAVLSYDTAFTNAIEATSSMEEDVCALEEVVASLEAELAALEHADDNEGAEEEEESVGGVPTSLAAYYSFLTQRSEVMGELCTLEAALKGVAEGDGARVVGTWAATAALDEALWGQKAEKLSQDVGALGAKGAAVSREMPLSDATDGGASFLFARVRELQPKAAGACSAYATQQENSEATRAEMEAERVGLLTWCRQQKTNLDAMVEPDHAQEFCSSMLANFAAMDKNFQVLLDFTYQLPGDEVLQRNMLECNEVWLNLQVSAYERMRHALLEVHPKSKLEDEVREFITFTEEVQTFVQQVRELFSNTNDPESDRFVRPVLEEADALLSEYGMHEGLPKQLQDFCNRMDCLRDSYSNLRRAVLSRLTFLTSSVPALTASMRRKEEYVARMKDLKGWVEVKSQGETWGDIHDRILSIKALIEKERISLNEARGE